MNWPMIVVVVITVPLASLASLYIISHAGGWAALSKRFPATEKPAGKTYYCRSGSVGQAGYGACLNLHVVKTGLYMSVAFPFRFAHPPLFIPWEEFHSTSRKWLLFWPVTDTYVGMPVAAHLTLPTWVSAYIGEVE